MSAPHLAAAFDPRAWHWIVGGDRGRLYSSATNTWIVEASRVAAVLAGGRVTIIPSLADLAVVLRDQAPGHVPDWLLACADFVQPEPGAHTTAQLLAYVPTARWRAEVAGTSVRLSTGELVRVSTARGDARAALTAELVRIAAGLRADGEIFKFADGARAVSNDDMRTAAAAGLAHVQACFDTEAEVVLALSAATPTVTLLAQVDAAFV